MAVPSFISFHRLFSLAILLAVLVMALQPAAAQVHFVPRPPGPQPPAPSTTAEPDGPIEDNSFLVEEAYNQEDGVVQHISGFSRMWNSKDWVYNFTQEWPGLRNPRHQYSYTVAVSSLGAFPGAGPGFGDISLNYRYQLLRDDFVAFSPRVSLLLPTGNSRLGRGYGGFGIQGNLPVSLRLAERLVTHTNVGATIIPRAKNEFDERATATGYSVGQSFIYLAHPRFNVMMETLWGGSEAVVADGKTQRAHTLLLSPGVRWAHNLSNGLQIVPGVAVPIGVGPSAGEKGLILYLSLEHSFKAPGAK